MLNPDIILMLQYLKGKDIAERIELTTNGSMLNDDICKAIIDSKIDFVRISIYAVTDENELAITRNAISVNSIFSKVERLKNLRDAVHSEKPFIYVKAFESLSNTDKRIFLDKYSSVADEVEFEKVMNFNGVFSPEGLEEKDAMIKGHEVCPYPFYFMIINPDGRVGVCCTDFLQEVTVGNTNIQSLQDIWEGTELRAFQKLQLSKKRRRFSMCSKCELFISDDFIRDNIDNLSLNEFNKRLLLATKENTNE